MSITEEQLTEWEDITASGELCVFGDGVFTVLSQLIAEVWRLRRQRDALRARVAELEGKS